MNPPAFTRFNLNLSLVRDTFPGAVGTLALGQSLFAGLPGPPRRVPSRQSGQARARRRCKGSSTIYFNLYLPSGQTPAGGWPVAIFGHPNGGYKEDPSLSVASSMAAQGIATIAINGVGHGFGPLGALTVSESVGAPVTFSAGGRGIDQDGDGLIAGNEGLEHGRATRCPLFQRWHSANGRRPDAARAGHPGRDGRGRRRAARAEPLRIFYFGQSFGANYGTVFLAVDPSVRAGVLTVAGDPLANRQWGAGRAALGDLLTLDSRRLSIPPGSPPWTGVLSVRRFHENVPLRNGVPVTVSLADGTTQVIQSPVIDNMPRGHGDPGATRKHGMGLTDRQPRRLCGPPPEGPATGHPLQVGDLSVRKGRPGRRQPEYDGDSACG